jgi:Aspartate racemase
MRYIYQYKAGKPLAQREPLVAIIKHLQARGAEAIVLGCTELPMITSGIESPLPLIDPTLLWARAAVLVAQEE